jgi:predicted DNA-binding transcriptional regulator AlpA
MASRLPQREVLRVAERENILPTNLPPRGLSRVQAAAYIGISPTLFDELVRDGRMPQPVRIKSRVLWDRLQLDAAFAALSDVDGDRDDPWSKVAV